MQQPARHFRYDLAKVGGAGPRGASIIAGVPLLLRVDLMTMSPGWRRRAFDLRAGGRLGEAPHRTKEPVEQRVVESQGQIWVEPWIENEVALLFTAKQADV